MTTFTLEPVNHVAPVVLTKAFGPVPDGEQWSIDARVCAVGGVDAVVDLWIQKSDGSNSCYRHKSKSVLNGDGSYDLEDGLVLPAGYELWDRSGNTDVAVSYTGTKLPA